MAIQGISNLLSTSLAQSQSNFGILAQQIASGDRLARPSFDPSAFIASERVLSQLGGLEAVNSSLQRGRSVLSIAETSLSGIGDQLNDIRRLTIQSFNAVGGDRAAIQGALNNTIDQVERNLGSTRFAGVPLRNAAFQTTDDSASVLSKVEFTRTPRPVGDGISVSVEVNAAATSAATTITGAAASAAGNDVEFELRGNEGRADIRVAQGASEQDFADAINARSTDTGIEALVNGADIEIRSVAAGSEQGLVLTDTNASGITGTGGFTGSDADVSVNGLATEADGNLVSFNSNGLTGSFVVDASTVANTSTQLEIVGGGITLPLDASGRTATFGFSAFDGSLGSSSGIGSLGDLRTGGRLDGAGLGDRLAVLDAARDEVLTNRVLLGVADNGLASSQSFNESLSTELSAAFADLRSVDFAAAATSFQQEIFKQELQVSLIRQSNLSQAGVLRLLSPLA